MRSLKNVLKRLPFFGLVLAKWRKRRNPVRGRWRALREEVGWWSEYISDEGGPWPDEYTYRFDPESEVGDPALREALSELPQTTVSILDVGAGPASTVGCRFPGKHLNLVAVDPLADRYSRLLARKGLRSPTRTERLEGESLEEHFGRNRFHIAYARNAIDHTVDPVPIIEQMLAVVRPGGYVVLKHRRNEAVEQHYIQLHRWNFDVRDGHFVIWRPGQETDMTERLKSRAGVSCRLEDDWVACRLAKPDGRERARQDSNRPSVS